MRYFIRLFFIFLMFFTSVCADAKCIKHSKFLVPQNTCKQQVYIDFHQNENVILKLNDNCDEIYAAQKQNDFGPNPFHDSVLKNNSTKSDYFKNYVSINNSFSIFPYLKNEIYTRAP